MRFMDAGVEGAFEVLMVNQIAHFLGYDQLFVVEVVEEVLQKATDKLAKD